MARLVAHFALLCPKELGHLLPMCNLGSALVRRGHRASVMGEPEVAELAGRFGLGWLPLQPRVPPRLPLNDPAQLLVSRRRTRWFCYISDLVLDQGWRLLLRDPADALVVDSTLFGGGTLAERLGVPFITVSAVVCPGPERGLTGAGAKDVGGLVRGTLLRKPAFDLVNRYRRDWGLAPLHSLAATLSPVARIGQLCPEMDPQHLEPAASPVSVRVGSLTADRTVDLCPSFPWERLDGRPVICATLGTVSRPQYEDCLTRIAQACQGLPGQLVLSVGQNWPERALESIALAGSPLLVRFSPLALLERAVLLVCHGGANTVLEALSRAVPLVMLPFEADQPLVAHRVVRAGAGLSARARRVTVAELRGSIERVLCEPAFRERATALSRALAAAGGAARAAEIVEQAAGLGPSRARA